MGPKKRVTKKVVAEKEDKNHRRDEIGVADRQPVVILPVARIKPRKWELRLSPLPGSTIPIMVKRWVVVNDEPVNTDLQQIHPKQFVFQRRSAAEKTAAEKKRAEAGILAIRMTLESRQLDIQDQYRQRLAEKGDEEAQEMQSDDDHHEDQAAEGSGIGGDDGLQGGQQQPQHGYSDEAMRGMGMHEHDYLYGQHQQQQQQEYEDDDDDDEESDE